MLAVNLKSVFGTTRAALPALKQSRGGTLSTAGMVGLMGEARRLRRDQGCNDHADQVLTGPKGWTKEDATPIRPKAAKLSLRTVLIDTSFWLVLRPRDSFSVPRKPPLRSALWARL